MQRLICALAALLTLFTVGPLPVRAQHANEMTPEPAHKPQGLDGSTSAALISHGDAESQDHAVITTDDGALLSTNDANAVVVGRASAIVVGRNETVDNIVVRNRPLILEGHVRHDVMAINSDVMIKPSATVGNLVDVVGGRVDNQAPERVRIVRQDAGVAPLLDGALASSAVRSDSPQHARPQGSWPGGQFALLMFGMLAGLAIHLLTPRAARQTSDVVATDRARSLAFGLIAVLLLAPCLMLGAAVVHSPLGLILSPFVAAFALLCAGLLIYGWLCGMAEVGFLLQRKLGVRQGSWFAQTTFGLGGFFLVNLILGSVWKSLGVCGLAIEGLVALMGLGAVVISGFGADPHWLSARLNGELPWLARTPRL